jgi:hypothetical protein
MSEWMDEILEEKKEKIKRNIEILAIKCKNIHNIRVKIKRKKAQLLSFLILLINKLEKNIA